MTDKILVFVNCASLMEASAIAHALVEQRLVVCASVGTHTQSLFIWKGEQQEGTEYPLTLKTRLEYFAAIETEVRRLHSYENPEILAVPILTGSAAYLGWMDACLTTEALEPKPLA